MATIRIRLSGEALTERLRSFMESDRPDSAWRAMVDGFDLMIAAEHGPGIFDGTHKFTGDETGMDVEPDLDSADYRKTLAEVYGGRFYLNGGWYRARAKVKSYGPEVEGDAVKGRKTAYDQAQEHAEAGEIVWAVPGHGLVIFEPTNPLPHWYKPYRNVQEAVGATIAARGELETVGWEDRPEVKEFRVLSSYRGTSDPTVKAIVAARMGNTDHMTDRMIEEALPGWRKEILSQAGAETIDLVDRDGVKQATVPRAPFLRWALLHTDHREAAPWREVCPSGLRLGTDSPCHSDWIVGAGINIETYDPDGAIQNAAYFTMGQLQGQYREMPVPAHEYSATVLAPGEDVTGFVGMDVIVLPNMSPDHSDRVIAAKAVITERGGALVHLAIVAREAGVPMVLVQNAMTLFRPGTMVRVSTKNGSVIIR